MEDVLALQPGVLKRQNPLDGDPVVHLVQIKIRTKRYAALKKCWAVSWVRLIAVDRQVVQLRIRCIMNQDGQVEPGSGVETAPDRQRVVGLLASVLGPDLHQLDPRMATEIHSVC